MTDGCSNYLFYRARKTIIIKEKRERDLNKKFIIIEIKLNDKNNNIKKHKIN